MLSISAFFISPVLKTLILLKGSIHVILSFLLWKYSSVTSSFLFICEEIDYLEGLTLFKYQVTVYYVLLNLPLTLGAVSIATLGKYLQFKIIMKAEKLNYTPFNITKVITRFVNM